LLRRLLSSYIQTARLLFDKKRSTAGARDMRGLIVILAALTAATSAGHAQTQLFGPIGQVGCITTYLGQTICAPPGGVVMVNEFGQPVCGRGQCVRNLGQIACSSQAAGYAVLELGQIKCTGGCESASSSYCQTPRASPPSTRLTRLVLVIAATVAADGFFRPAYAQCPPSAQIFIDPRLVPQRPTVKPELYGAVMADPYIDPMVKQQYLQTY